MKASTRLPFLIATALVCSVAAAQFGGAYFASVNQPIPPFGSGGAAGGCNAGSPNVTEHTLVVPDAFVVSQVRVELNLTHTYVGDLTLTLSHCGTSVVLYDRQPGSGSNLNGVYAFDDQAILYFANYVTVAPTVPPNTYLPVNSLSPFHGMSSGGAWKVSICDHNSGDIGQLGSINLVLTGAQIFGGSISPPLQIPDGSGGQCVNPVARAINVVQTGTVDEVSVTLGMYHPYVRDLHVTLSHDGVVATLIAPGTIPPYVGVQGLYTFSNESVFLQSFAAVGGFTQAGFDIPPGLYTPVTPMSVFAGHPKTGVWMVTVCDTQGQDVGNLWSASIRLSDSAWNLTISQPFGPSSLLFENEGGVPGHSFLNLATVVPGSFPFGWLNGLDISMNDILVEVGLGAPVIGPLDVCGGALSSIPGPIPAGLAIQFVSFELDAAGSPVASKHAFQYVTQ